MALANTEDNSRNPQTLSINHSAAWAITSVNHKDKSSPSQAYYDEIQCTTEHSNDTCSFPLLTEHQERCGYFAKTTSWQHLDAAYPNPSMTVNTCKVPPVTMAPQSLCEYILGRNITSIITFGDCQGVRYTAAFRRIFKLAGFNCTQVKTEPNGFQTSLDYYTKGTGFTTRAKVDRTCTSCVSNLQICSDTKYTKRHTVAVEYISMMMTSQRSINLSHPDCQKNDTFHPLCLNLTQQ